MQHNRLEATSFHGLLYHVPLALPCFTKSSLSTSWYRRFLIVAFEIVVNEPRGNPCLDSDSLHSGPCKTLPTKNDQRRFDDPLSTPRTGGRLCFRGHLVRLLWRPIGCKLRGWCGSKGGLRSGNIPWEGGAIDSIEVSSTL